MKKILLIAIFCFPRLLFTHEQEATPVHQRIVYEAYKLLKLQLSKEANGIADCDNYIGEVKNYGVDYWYQISNLTGGAFHEDVNDFIWNVPWSLTHFWNPDHPYTMTMKMPILGYRYPSAYYKASVIVNDDYAKVFIIPDSWGLFFGYLQMNCLPQKGNKLYKIYNSDKLWVSSSYKYHTIGKYYSEMRTNYYNPYWSNQINKKIFFNILGRLAHLLTDMGVPEHAKGSAHITTNQAPYEHWLGKRGKIHYENEFYWTAERVYKERGGFVNPFCEYNDAEIFYLFYTTAQLSDIFASFGAFYSEGNTKFDKSIGEIESIYKSYFPPEYTGSDFKFYAKPTDSHGIGYTWKAISNEIGRKYRDALLPYTIRATAGLLYKYIIEAKMQFPNATEDDKGSIYDQQQELDLFNQDINGDYYTFRAEGNPGRITVASENRPANYPADFVIGSDTKNVTFRASKIIIFKPGFVAKEGSDVRAYIVPNCSKTNQSGNCQQCLDEDFNPQYDRSN